MAARKDLSSNYKLSANSGVGPSGIRRFQNGEVAAQIDSVEKVAKAFKLRACDILDPDLLKRLAAGEPLRMGEPRPPVMPDAEWRAMSPRARALVEDLCARTLAGQLQEGDIAWLHDSLQRINPPAQATPVADMVLKAKPITRTSDLVTKASGKP